MIMRETIKGLWGKSRELIVYCMIGCTGASLDFVVYVILTKCFGMHYQFANLISVSFGIVNNFFWNCFFNFKTKDRLAARLVSFYAVGMLGWALSAGCLWVFIELLGINPLLAKLGTIFFVTLVQFSLNKLITFRRTKTRPTRQEQLAGADDE